LVGGLIALQLTGCAQGLDHRIERAYRLARNPTDGNKNRIEALLKDDDRDLRATALVLMETIDTARARRMAETALQDPDGLVRAAAVSVVGTDAGGPALAALTALASDDPVWQVRARVLETVAVSDDPALREKFANALSDPVRHVRRAALRAGVANPGLLPADRLADLVVSDPDWENRVEAAQALGASKDPAAYPALDAARRDPNEFVRASAAVEEKTLQAAGVVR
jgi:HEAT repeat protein